MEFKGKVVLITGAGSGIGRATAVVFAKEGAQVIVSDINVKRGKETVSLVKEKQGSATFIKTDVADYADMVNLHNSIITTFGSLDIAVNNAGVAPLPVASVDTTVQEWDRVMAINTSSVFYGMKLQIAQMLKQGEGVIVNTASVAGLRGLPKNIAYTASKHAVVGMTKTAAMEYGKKNIRINAVCPAFTVTALFDPAVMDLVSAGLSDKLKKSIPMQRFGSSEEIAESILWLCSKKASFVHGLALPIDGGLTA